MQMNEAHLGDSWSDLRKELFTPEEIAAKWKSVLDSSLQGRQQR